MRSRSSADDQVADVTRRRLDALIAELAVARGETPPVPAEPVPPRSLTSEPRWLRSERSERLETTAEPPGKHAHRPLPARGRLAGWIGDRLPVGLQGRAHLGSAQFGLVALVVALGLVLGAWWLVRAGGSSSAPGDVVPPRPVTTSAAVAPSTTVSPAAQSSAAPTDGAAGEIVVDVVGKVRRPGIAVLPAGSRVVDAVKAAGGMRPGVDPATVNMARLLADGEQIFIGLPGAAALPGVATPSADASGGPAPGALVNLNTADQATLETLPGVGPVTAAAILEWRDEHGGFTSVDELLEVSGIGDATLAEIAPHVTL